MYYVDPQRTATRRDSSLVTIRNAPDLESRQSPLVKVPVTLVPSTTNVFTESATSLSCRPPGSVRTEIITILFDSMLNSIVKSWTTIEIKVNEEEEESRISTSEQTLAARKKKPGSK